MKLLTHSHVYTTNIEAQTITLCIRKRRTMGWVSCQEDVEKRRDGTLLKRPVTPRGWVKTSQNKRKRSYAAPHNWNEPPRSRPFGVSATENRTNPPQKSTSTPRGKRVTGPPPRSVRGKTPTPVKNKKPKVTQHISPKTIQTVTAILPDLLSLLRRAFDLSTQKDGWTHLGTLGQKIHHLHLDFDPRAYGHKKLSLLVRAYPDVFEIREEIAQANLYIRAKM